VQKSHSSYLTITINQGLLVLSAQMCGFYDMLQLTRLFLNFWRQADASLGQWLSTQHSSMYQW